MQRLDLAAAATALDALDAGAPAMIAGPNGTGPSARSPQPAARSPQAAGPDPAEVGGGPLACVTDMPGASWALVPVES
ncbi:hypothetical protein OHA19_05825 [Streptomyces sp. NBC_00012]|uniref:hypothetical protein n=1 Tax=Streptomyces sp. NBC_00012 TaxID=2975621 RepID=UPI00324EEE46